MGLDVGAVLPALNPRVARFCMDCGEPMAKEPG